MKVRVVFCMLLFPFAILAVEREERIKRMRGEIYRKFRRFERHYQIQETKIYYINQTIL